jgi:HD-like signal output (HDOD) protein/CheY-like chemotaxis protein
VIAPRAPRVLFVDDEPLVLRSLDRALRTRKVPWEARFVDTSPGALALLAAEPFDVVIADLRIPEMDGVELLTEIQHRHPRVARLVLSGQVGTDDCLRAMRVAHQCIAKPCNIDALRHVVQRLALSQRLLDEGELATAATRLSCLPSPPHIHVEVGNALARDAGLAEIAQIVDGDVAITAKLIQVVNSAFFTQGTPVTTVQRALMVLGTEVVRDLLLGVEVFRGFDGGPGSLARVEALRAHSKRVAQLARSLAPRELAGDAFVAGMLHDIGDLVLACLEEPPSQLSDHGRAGGFLLGLWGIKDAIVDAITYHHAPGAVPEPGLVDLLYVAELVIGEREEGRAAELVDPAWLERNPPETLERARALAQTLSEQAL